MQQPKRINTGYVVGVLIAVAVFRLLLLALTFYSYVEYNKHLATKLPITFVLNFKFVFPPFILLAEAICYYLLRKRIFQLKFVRLHLWISVLSSFFLPFVQIILILFILPLYLTKTELINIGKQFDVYLSYGGWIIFAFARLFFIIAMRTSVAVPPVSEKTTESTGYLDEFSDE
jgi:hypothetical protein